MMDVNKPSIRLKTLYNLVMDTLKYRGFSEEESFEIVKHLLDGNGDKRVCDIIRKMPFGKYRGKTLTSLFQENPDYLDWIITNLKNSKFVNEKYPWLIPAIKDLFE